MNFLAKFEEKKTKLEELLLFFYFRLMRIKTIVWGHGAYDIDDYYHVYRCEYCGNYTWYLSQHASNNTTKISIFKSCY